MEVSLFSRVLINRFHFFKEVARLYIHSRPVGNQHEILSVLYSLCIRNLVFIFLIGSFNVYNDCSIRALLFVSVLILINVLYVNCVGMPVCMTHMAIFLCTSLSLE